MNTLKENILKTLLYYDIFRHPLVPDEIFSLLPQNSISKSEFNKALIEYAENNPVICSKDNYYFVGHNEDFIELRRSKEIVSKKAWKHARLITHLIKRFPFVR